MKNDKRGIAPIALVMAVFIGIVLLIFLAGGGLKTAFDVSKFISSVPTIVWIILGIIILLKLIGGKKR